MQIDKPDNKPRLPNPKGIDLEIGIKWTVLVKDKIPKERDDWVYYCVDVQSYEKMARNNTEILRWIKETQWRLDYYRDEASINDHPK